MVISYTILKCDYSRFWNHLIEPPHDKTIKMTFAPSKDSDQPGRPPSLIGVFAVHTKNAWVLGYPMSAQQRLWSDWADARLWSDWADAKADLSLRWAQVILLVLSCNGSVSLIIHRFSEMHGCQCNNPLCELSICIAIKCTFASYETGWTFTWLTKQVAQRATIAHLSPMCQHPLISNKAASKVVKNLNSFQIREQLFFQGLVPPMSAVWTCQKSNLL